MRPLTSSSTSAGSGAPPPPSLPDEELDENSNGSYTVDAVEEPKLTWREQLKNWPGLLKKYWWALLLFFGLSFVGVMVVYIRVLTDQAAREREPIAGATSNMDLVLPKADTRAAAPRAPSEVLERKISQEEANGGAGVVAPSDMANTLAVDTFGRAVQRREALRKAAAAKPTLAQLAPARPIPDTAEVTVRDAQTGVYRTARVAVPRQVSYGGSSPASSQNANAWLAAQRAAAAGRPTDPNAAALLAASMGQQELPPPDVFGTVKAGGSYRYSGNSNDTQQLMPDVFYKCVVNGAQTVRSGSVALLRLTEDAVISGVTFPKNLVFAALVNVETNRVTFSVNRLGPTRVQAGVFDYNYLPGIMIDPNKKSQAVNAEIADTRSAIGQETAMGLGTAASAVVNPLGVAGARVGTGLVSRIFGRGQTRLREVALPDGYPILITSGGAGQFATGGRGF